MNQSRLGIYIISGNKYMYYITGGRPMVICLTIIKLLSSNPLVAIFEQTVRYFSMDSTLTINGMTQIIATLISWGTPNKPMQNIPFSWINQDNFKDNESSLKTVNCNTWNFDNIVCYFFKVVRQQKKSLKEIIINFKNVEFTLTCQNSIANMIQFIKLCCTIEEFIFPIRFLFDKWLSHQAQKILIEHLIINPKCVNWAYTDVHCISEEYLEKYSVNENYQEHAAWRSIDLVQFLFKCCNDEINTNDVRLLLTTAEEKCPGILLISLIQSNIPWTSLKYETVCHCIYYLYGRDYVTNVICVVWEYMSRNTSCEDKKVSSKLKELLLFVFSKWFNEGVQNGDVNKRLCYINDIFLKLNILPLVIASKFCHLVLGIACMSAEKDIKSFYGWLNNTFTENEEFAISTCLQFIQLMCPQLMQKNKATYPEKYYGMPLKIVITILTCILQKQVNIRNETFYTCYVIYENMETFFSPLFGTEKGTEAEAYFLDFKSTFLHIIANFSKHNSNDEYKKEPLCQNNNVYEKLPSDGYKMSPKVTYMNNNPQFDQAFRNMEEYKKVNINPVAIPLAVRSVTYPKKQTTYLQQFKNSSRNDIDQTQSAVNNFNIQNTQMHHNEYMNDTVTPENMGYMNKMLPNIKNQQGNLSYDQLPPFVKIPRKTDWTDFPMDLTANLEPDISKTELEYTKKLLDKERYMFNKKILRELEKCGSPIDCFPGPKKITEVTNYDFMGDTSQLVYVNTNPENVLMCEYDAIINKLKKVSDETGANDILQNLNALRKNGNQHSLDTFWLVFKYINDYTERGEYLSVHEVRLFGCVYGNIINHKIIADDDSNFYLSILMKNIISDVSRQWGFSLSVLELIIPRFTDFPQLCHSLISLKAFDSLPKIMTSAVEQSINVSKMSFKFQKTFMNGSLIYKNATFVIDNCLDFSNLTSPTIQVRELVCFIFNSLTNSNTLDKACQLKPHVTEFNITWIARYLVVYRAAVELNLQFIFFKFVQDFDLPEFSETIRSETIKCIKIILNLPTKKFVQYKKKLKNLGRWTGLIFLSKNNAIIYRDLDVKSLLYEAYHRNPSEFLIIFQFVARFFENCAESIFKLRNAWTLGIMRVFSEIYKNMAKLAEKSFYELEIETLSRTLSWNLLEEEFDVFIFDEGKKLESLKFQMCSDDDNLKYEEELKKEPETRIDSGNIKQEFNLNGSVNVLQTHNLEKFVDVKINSDNNIRHPDDQVANKYTYDEIYINTMQSLQVFFVIDENINRLFNLDVLKNQFCKEIEEALKKTMLFNLYEHTSRMCMPTVETLVRKDFALDSEEANMRAACHMSLKSLASSIINIIHRETVYNRLLLTILRVLKCSESVLNSIMNPEIVKNVVQLFGDYQKYDESYSYNFSDKPDSDFEGATQMDDRIDNQYDGYIKRIAVIIAKENMELIMNIVVKLCIEQASNELDNIFSANDYRLRRMAKRENRKYVDLNFLNYNEKLPNVLKFNVGSTLNSRISIYHEMGKNITGFMPMPPDACKDSVLLSIYNHQWDELFLREFFILVDTILQQMANILSKQSLNSPIHWIRPLQDSLNCMIRNQSPSSVEYFLNKLVDFMMAKVCDGFIQPNCDLRDLGLDIITIFMDRKLVSSSNLIAYFTKFFMDRVLKNEIGANAINFVVRHNFLSFPTIDKTLSSQIDNKKSSLHILLYMLYRLNSMNYKNLEFEFVCLIHTIGDLLFGNCSLPLKQILEMSEQLYPKLCQQILPKNEKSEISLAGLQINENAKMKLMYDKRKANQKNYQNYQNQKMKVKRPEPIDNETISKPEITFDKSHYQTVLINWLRIYNQYKGSNKIRQIYLEIKPILDDTGFFRANPQQTTTFFRFMYNSVVREYYNYYTANPNNNLDVSQDILHYIDATVRFIVVVLVNNQYAPLQPSPEHSAENENTNINIILLRFLTNVFGAISMTMTSLLSQNNFDILMIPFQRIINNLILELYAPTVIDGSVYSQLSTLICNFLCFLSPKNICKFLFSWLNLISNRILIQYSIGPESTEKSRTAYNELIMTWLTFFMPFLDTLEINSTVSSLYKATGRIFKMLYNDYPEFLLQNHLIYCDTIPLNCVNLRNIILCAKPKDMFLSDAPCDNFTIFLLEQFNQPPICSISVDTLILKEEFKTDLNFYLKNRRPSTFLADVINYIQIPKDSFKKYSAPLITGLILYVARYALAKLKEQNQSPSVDTIQPSSYIDIFLYLSIKLDSEGRYIYLTSIANQLRYPNTHTHYFTCVILYLFGHTATAHIQEQIIRVLLERLICCNPPPFGCRVTFEQILKDKKFNFWNLKFAKFNPKFTKLIKTIEERTPLEFDEVKTIMSCKL
ncbi:hypothetical protein A3Q56_00109 [Intoshia linei]|uniref:Uncharacterized protein n=1 Tax=Intoshia linei TaxID=1819745 RepID=A0A177BEZ9_9BILA|nr:hypothetical protein A3Q56_00109 [Intoshia linei]